MKEIALHPRNYKRRLASEKECKIDLNKELPILFKSFSYALSLYEKEIIQTPPESRARAFEASLLNSKMIQSIQKHFPENWRFGKYKRFILSVEGYTVLFKKLNSKDKPMNIKTLHNSAISNQRQMSLFSNEEEVVNPILIFGYRKDRVGNIFDPKLVYIDEEKVRWTITADAVEKVKEVKVLATTTIEKATPTLKESKKDKRKTSS